MSIFHFKTYVCLHFFVSSLLLIIVCEKNAEDQFHAKCSSDCKIKLSVHVHVCVFITYYRDISVSIYTHKYVYNQSISEAQTSSLRDLHFPHTWHERDESSTLKNLMMNTKKKLVSPLLSKTRWQRKYKSARPPP